MTTLLKYLTRKIELLLGKKAPRKDSWTIGNVGPYRPHFSVPKLTPDELELVERFSDLYYSKIDNFAGLHTIVLSWLGYELFKCPLDLWIYQEIITINKPQLIIEVGTYKGGSALFLATIFDLLGSGDVITIDIEESYKAVRPKHPRITYLHGSSTDPEVFEVAQRASYAKPATLIILDGDHRYDHVLAELRLYSSLVPPGGYLIVEDTNINGHPTYPTFGPGPWEAVETFLAENNNFYADRSCERFLLTMNPRGYLRRETVEMSPHRGTK